MRLLFFGFGFYAWPSVFGVCLIHVKKTLQLFVEIALFDPVIVYLDNVE